MRQISPGELFPIRRQLNDPLDTGTNYVRAVVRWSDSDSAISFNGNAYINLTDAGSNSQRFYGTMRVPADKLGGAGSWLIITTTVYTDSGYTTVNNNYEIFEEQYLVMDRLNPYKMGGGGGDGITADTVRRIVREEVTKVQPVIHATDLKPVIEALAQLKTAVESIDIPEQEKVDLKPVLDALAASQKEALHAINDIPGKIPKPEKIDLSPINSRLDRFADVFDPKGYQEKMDQLFARIKDFFRNDVESIKADTGSILGVIQKWAEGARRFMATTAENDNDEPEETT